MPAIDNLQFREALVTDVPAIAACHAADPNAGFADPRMAAYLKGRHHPQQALPERVGYVALVNDAVVGYIAGLNGASWLCGGSAVSVCGSQFPPVRNRNEADAAARRVVSIARGTRSLRRSRRR